jgi:predicted nucleic acid-binding protein
LLESEAKLKIQENIRAGKFELIWSYLLDYENNKNPFRERREQILTWQMYSENDIDEDKFIMKTALLIESHGIKKLDALHIACAIKGNAEYFLTTDDGVLKKAASIHNIKITDPIGFIKEVSL